MRRIAWSAWVNRHHDLPEFDPYEGQKPGVFRSYWTAGLFFVVVIGALVLIGYGISKVMSIIVN